MMVSFLLLLFSDRISCSSGWPWTCFVDKDDQLQPPPRPSARIIGRATTSGQQREISEGLKTLEGKNIRLVELIH